MKSTLAVAVILTLITALLLAGMLVNGVIGTTVQDALAQDDDAGLATATSGQRATAVCVGLLNWRNCNIEQDSIAETAQPAPRLDLSDGTLGFVMFGMTFMAAGLLAMILARFIFGRPGEDW